MKDRWRVLLIGAIFLFLMSALHTHMLPISIDWDVNNAMVIIGIISFIISCLLIPASSKGALFLYILLGPLLFTISFSFLEISGEFNPNNISKGWGIIYFMACYPSSFIGTTVGLLVGWLIRRFKGKR